MKDKTMITYYVGGKLPHF